MEIKRSVFIRAPRSRVWRALTTAEEFSKWFESTPQVPFTPGVTVPMVARNKGWEGYRYEITIEKVEPERTFSWTWSHEGSAPTHVEFTLDEVSGGTQLTVHETGFDRLTAEERAKWFKLNSEGWDYQIANIERYVLSQAA
jgi:uncharacterized protein YndB with AHSA1/START domain